MFYTAYIYSARFRWMNACGQRFKSTIQLPYPSPEQAQCALITFPSNESFSYEVLRASGYANYGGADLGEIIVITPESALAMKTTGYANGNAQHNEQ